MQFLAIPDDGEAVAAQAAGNRFDQHDRGGGRYGGVHGVAALEQHTQPGLGCQRMRRGHHVARKQRDAYGRIRVDPVKGFHRLVSKRSERLSRRRYSRDLIKSI
ncbi:hypothetical protein G6F65_020120 [Rhizopus arrhizus]|nr:hypothetical protein G6F65_020120 [Rhizopus arrhizus]